MPNQINSKQYPVVGASNPHIAIYPDYETAREYHDGGMETIFEAKVFSLDSKPANTFTSEF